MFSLQYLLLIPIACLTVISVIISHPGSVGILTPACHVLCILLLTFVIYALPYTRAPNSFPYCVVSSSRAQMQSYGALHFLK